MAAILEIQNVTKTFRGGVRAVDDVTLAVEEGEFLTVLGPSGCGKTTTLRMVGGFEFPDAGRIVLDGRDVTDLPPYRRPVNMMFQDFALFPHLTVAQNIGYGLTIAGMNRREAAREVEEALHTIELLDKADRRPAELLHRPEAARGAGACPDPATEDPAARRAVIGARRQAP